MPLPKHIIAQRAAVLIVLGSLRLGTMFGAEPDPPQAEQSLHHAISQGDHDLWQRLLREGANITERDHEGNTSLHLAALHGHSECVDQLLRRGADTNATNNWGTTPLIYGVVNADIVRSLLKHGANPNAVSKLGTTPLISAVKRGQSYDVARLLIEAGANVNAEVNGEDGYWSGNPLYFAIGSGDQRTITLLISSGAELDVQGNRISPLQQAVSVGDMITVKRLVDAGVDINHMYDAIDSAGTAVCWAMWTEYPDIASYLIDHGADLQLTASLGNQTPPIVWSGFGQFGDSLIARKMVAKGLDVNASNATGDTALSYALKAGPNTELVRYLTSVGATPPSKPEKRKLIPRNHVPAPGAVRDELIRENSQRAINLMQHSSEVFLQRRDNNCVSCHHQILPALAYAMGQERGLRLDYLALGHQLADQIANKNQYVEAARHLLDFSFGWNRRLVSLAALKYTPDEFTEAMARFVRETQGHDGTWLNWGRPPHDESRWAEVAWGIRALRLFRLAGQEETTQQSIQRALEWLRQQAPRTNNERSSQLLGLGWGGAPATTLQPYVQALLNEQRSDGGWSQLTTLESDAWATGKTLYALYEVGGVSTDDPSYQRGVEFLLRTQFPDGSWWVRGRGWPFQPHFDSQFPHGRDQWISIAATAWGTMALLATLEPVQTFAPLPTGQELIAKWKEAEAEKEARAKSDKDLGFTSVTVNFNRDIQPLLERSCLDCHSGESDDASGMFSMDSRDLLLKGGQSNLPAIHPGDSKHSPLIRFALDQVEDLEMPPLRERDSYPAFTTEEVNLLRAWIDQGAQWEDADNK